MNKSDNAVVMDRLLTADNVAERLACSARTVWALAADGVLPRVRMGKCSRFRESDITRFIESGGVSVVKKGSPRQK